MEMDERQDVNDTSPGRWVPVLDAVEAVIDRIAREGAWRQGRRRPESAEAASA